ncbi:MAG: NAD-dependent epimerase/dehydratase family protein [Gemmatimonadota bacterium]
MHTILGANGVIGRALSHSLVPSADRIRQVSRSPRRVNATDELVAADLLDADATRQAVAGSDVAYLVAGLKYDLGVWQEQWPRVMRNVIDACARSGTRLVFFDNVYAYGRVEGVMTEETPFNPTSRKGEVRAQIATMLLDAMQRGDVQAMIVRSADFYGPGAVQSLTHAAVFERLRAGKTPQWIGNPKAVHSFTYTPDAGRAIAILARSSDAWGQTWHAPTSSDPITAEQFVRLACELAGRPYGMMVAPGWLLRLMGLFTPVLRENHEMMYQFQHDYRFDSSRILSAYGSRRRATGRASPRRSPAIDGVGAFRLKGDVYVYGERVRPRRRFTGMSRRTCDVLAT